MLENLARLTGYSTRLFTAENVNGERGKGGMADPAAGIPEEASRLGQLPDLLSDQARELGQKWKIRPCVTLPKNSTITLVDADGQGSIGHMWFTMDYKLNRDVILRVYWDGEEEPSVESPIGDFFCQPFHRYHPVTSVPINVNPTGGMNCYFPMPFKKHVKITATNLLERSDVTLFYAVSMIERPVGDDEGYFHAKFNRTHNTNGQDYVILDGVKGHGQYVGTAIGWQQNSEGWWGEGEVKAFIDGDGEFPTYVGTGTEDYFGGAWGFVGNFTAPFLGYKDLSNYLDNRETNRVGNRHAMYRFHIPDPIYFQESLKVTIQAIGWRSEGRFLPLCDDICSVAYWYQDHPHAPFAPLGGRNDLECV